MSDPSTWPTDFDALWNYDQPAESEQQFRALLPVAERSGDHGYLAELLSQIARAEGLQRKFDAAHTTLDRAAALIGARPSRAGVRYLLERGRVFNSAQQLPQAHVLFSEAWELAQALHEDGYAVDAAHMLAIVAPPEQKLAWERRALALAGESASATRAGLACSTTTGWSNTRLGSIEQALAMFERAPDARTAAVDAQAIPQRAGARHAMRAPRHAEGTGRPAGATTRPGRQARRTACVRRAGRESAGTRPGRGGPALLCPRLHRPCARPVASRE
ncbi:MAG: hypothetical protein U0Z44_01285 [Kouleothrix sp.]